MTSVKLSEDLTYRGFVNQYTFSNISHLNGEPMTFYWGVDPSGPSMTIGHLAAAMMVRSFMAHGHKAILLVGGATGLIGDPDGKKQERNLLSSDQIEQNKQNIVSQYRQIFGGMDFDVVDNYDWFRDMNYLDFLREIGKNTSMTQLLDREFIKNRIGAGGEGISYAEFSYALIQGYDFLHLYREKGATLQVAGADQWGNSISGVQLIRKLEGAEAHVWTVPLIINPATGVKFGKSEAGAIWLDPTLTTPYQFYQFWLNTDDVFAAELIKKYTTLDRSEIESIFTEHQTAPHKRLLQKQLAQAVTRTIHGDDRLASVERVTKALFSGGDISHLLSSDVEALALEITTIELGKSVIEVLIETRFATSNGEARKMIQSGAVSINGKKISQDQFIETPSLLKKGKYSFILIR